MLNVSLDTLSSLQIKEIEKLLISSILKEQMQYTGLSTKFYLRKYLFNNLNIHNIENFTANAYGDINIALRDTVMNISNISKTILVHPLLPNDYILSIIKLGFKIEFLSLDKETLQIDYNDLVNRVNIHEPKLVIHYTINQLLNETKEINRYLSNRGITFVVVDENVVFRDEISSFIESSDQLIYIKLVANNTLTDIIQLLNQVEVQESKLYIKMSFYKTSPVTINSGYTDKQKLNISFIKNILTKMTPYNSLDFINRIKSAVIKNTVSGDIMVNHADSAANIKKNFRNIQSEYIADFWFDILKVLNCNIFNISNLNEDQSQLKQKLNLIISKIKNSEHFLNEGYLPLVGERLPTIFHFYTNDQKLLYTNLYDLGITTFKLPVPQSLKTSAAWDHNSYLSNNVLIYPLE
jgi:hypothetical protein